MLIIVEFPPDEIANGFQRRGGIANDIVSPSAFATNPVQAMVPFAAAAVVVVVARKTGSLIWCAIVGMVAYALLTMVI